MNDSLGDHFFPWYGYWASLNPKGAALVTPSATLSYETLHSRIADIGSRFKLAGIRHGTRVVLDSTTMNEDWIIGLLSALYAGAQVIIPDTAWTPSERSTCLAVLNPSSVLVVGNNTVHLEKNPEHAAIDGEAGVWLFTSGTTSSPQPHFRSIALLSSMVYRVRERMPEDVTGCHPASLAVAPLYHGYGLVNTLLLTHALGGNVVLHDRQDARGMADSISKHAIQVLFGWPAHFKLLAEGAVKRDLRASSLRWAVSSSSKLAPVVARRFSENSGCLLRQQYGMTETGPLCLDDALDTTGDPTCIGRPLSGIEVQVFGSKNQPVPQDKTGMLAIRFAEGVMRPTHLLDGEFWRTGDNGKIDKKGRIYLLGRATPFTDERKEV